MVLAIGLAGGRSEDSDCKAGVTGVNRGSDLDDRIVEQIAAVVSAAPVVTNTVAENVDGTNSRTLSMVGAASASARSATHSTFSMTDGIRYAASFRQLCVSSSPAVVSSAWSRPAAAIDR